jgi:hypothetical protein
MNVGIVSKWFNRGQPVVGRYLRSGIDQLGHRSFVLAKPRREKGPMSGALERTGVWDQPDVTAASSFDTPLDEYMAWIEDNSIEVVLCDQNYQFAELAELRARGVRVIGRFVWEHFTEAHLEPARAATTSSTRSPSASASAIAAGGWRRRGCPGGFIRSCWRCRFGAARTAPCASSSRAASSAIASPPSR